MQVALWSETNKVTLCAKHDLVGVIDEDLPPNFNEYLFEGNRHGKQARCSSLSIHESRQIYFCTSTPCESLTTISGALSRKSGGARRSGQSLPRFRAGLVCWHRFSLSIECPSSLFAYVH